MKRVPFGEPLDSLCYAAFGETTTTRHKNHLLKRIVWPLQALAEGGLSELSRSPVRLIRVLPAQSLHKPDSHCKIRSNHFRECPFFGSVPYPPEGPLKYWPVAQ